MKYVDQHPLRGPHFRRYLPEVSLQIVRGSAKRTLRVVRPPVYLIGSAADCDLVLGDSDIPAIHTYLYVTAMGVSVRNIGKGPDLQVNDRIVEAGRILDGDRLRLGPYEFVVNLRPFGVQRSCCVAAQHCGQTDAHRGQWVAEDPYS